MNPYIEYAEKCEVNYKNAETNQLGGFSAIEQNEISENAPKVLIFAPHPDDECIIGLLPLRLMRECGMDVLDVPITLGSAVDRQKGRFAELSNACNYLGFGILEPRGGSLDKINFTSRNNDKKHWNECVEKICELLKENNPKAIFFPHGDDWNSTHIGTHYLIMDALSKMSEEFKCFIVETEFWAAMSDPNIMVEATAENLGILMTATSFHVEEVKRNPYHVRLPGYMQDNVRRGGELVGGQGGQVADFSFAELYKIQLWQNRKLNKILDSGVFLGKDDKLEIMLEEFSK
ncbi:MAG: PIG-L family deacetylase [Verrucomicrobiota bacterium]|nr:PIG-L family deacetylase [Verrucomicrobiota bacterium]